MRRFSVYDTMSRSVRLFQPRHPPRVGMFVCGLTPYADSHIGHGRTFVSFDVVARAIRHWGYRLFHVQNVTNLDDKLIERGGADGVDPLLLAERHFASYHRSMQRLGVTSVDLYPFATDYIPEILTQIQQLVAKGVAYAVDGSLYYEIAKFPAYGRLSGQQLGELRAGSRIDVDPKKRAPEDFAIWKAATPGEPSWETPWGPGRPGWHIEDTAITTRLLGERYDIHGGGAELKFPHHEAEIALAESASGLSPLVNYWMHAGLLTMKGEKMAKSLGNVISLEAALDEFGRDVLRFYYLNSVYRHPLDFEPGKSLVEAREAYDRLASPYQRLTEAMGRVGDREEGQDLPEELARTAAATVVHLDDQLADDFNTREAIATLFGWGRAMAEILPRSDSLNGAALAALAQPYVWGHELLGLFSQVTMGADPATRLEIAPIVELALAARRRARDRGDYAESDRIRAELEALGVQVEDQGATTAWRLRGGGPG